MTKLDTQLDGVAYTLEEAAAIGDRVHSTWKPGPDVQDTLAAVADALLPSAPRALLAVLELHADDGQGACTECGVDTYETPVAHPCPTAQAIWSAGIPAGKSW